MSPTKRIKAIAIAALAGLAITTTASADRVRGGATVNNAGPVTEVESPEIAVVRELEQGSGENDGFGSATQLAAPNDDRFAIHGALDEKDRECRDVDYYTVSGLAPLTDYQITQFGSANDKMSVGWFAGDLSINSASNGAEGKITVTTDESGFLMLACSAETDLNFNGEDNGTGLSHGLCGDYYLIVEVSLAGDVNGDDVVDIGDVRMMLNMIGDTGNSPADLTNDDIVNADDLRVLADLVQGKKAKKARRVCYRRAGKIEGQELKAAIAREAERLSATLNIPGANDPEGSSSSRRR